MLLILLALSTNDACDSQSSWNLRIIARYLGITGSLTDFELGRF